MNEQRFELRAPSPQTAVDIFRGKWTSNLSLVCDVTGTGTANLFADERLTMAANTLGKNGRLDGYSVLELGPLEGAQTYQLEQMGAREVVAVEANVDAFLKCLVVKEILGMNARFMCGDIVAFLANSQIDYDLVFASGILYHMADPLELIKQICLHSSRCFIWSHYFAEPQDLSASDRSPRTVHRNNFTTTYYEKDYPDMDSDMFLGGNRLTNAWMKRDDIARAFAHFGFDRATIVVDEPHHVNGPAFSCAFARSSAL